MTWLSINPDSEPYERQRLAAEIQGVATYELTPKQMADSYNLIEQIGCELPSLGRTFIPADTEEEWDDDQKDESQLTHEQVAQVAQEHEPFLTQLESLAISALASGNWWPVQDFISEVETWQGEQALREAKEKQAEDPMKDLWNLAFPKEPMG